MTFFFNDEAIRKSRARAGRYRRILPATGAAFLILFIVLCALTRTGNARIMLFLSMGMMIAAGWAIIALWLFAAEPARAEERHLDGLAKGETEIREGRITLDSDVFRIPKSVRVRKVRLETGEDEPLSLNLNERFTPSMPANGSLVRVQVVHKFITGIEVLEEGNGGTVPRGPSRGRRVWRAACRFFPAAVIWGMMAALLTGFVFNQITDTDPTHKIVIYADCGIRNAAELAEKLEHGLNGAVRMVKVHPFAYALFGTEALKHADLYIVPDSRKQDYAEWFEALPGTPPEGITVCDPESGSAVAGAYLTYASDNGKRELYRLYFGSGSAHREDGLALRAAELLMAVGEE